MKNNQKEKGEREKEWKKNKRRTKRHGEKIEAKKSRHLASHLPCPLFRPSLGRLAVVFRTLDEGKQRGKGRGPLEPRVLEQLSHRGPLVDVHFQTLAEEVSEVRRDRLGVLQLGGAIGGDQIQGLGYCCRCC